MVYYANHIENEAAYEAAISARIKENARKGRGARWLAEDATRADVVTYCQRRSGGSAFYLKLWDAYQEWHSFTDKQESMIRADMAKDAARRAEFIARDSGSVHVGTVGKREVFTLTLRRRVSFESDFGTVHIHVFADDSGNVVVHKGTMLGVYDASGIHFEAFEQGARVTGKATVKAHETREGVAQTKIQRPKFERAA